jgi:two-component system NtrC family sensor kinase
MTAVASAEGHGENTFWALEATPGAIVVSDARGRILFANEEALRLFGHAKSEITQRPVVTLLAPESQSTWAECMHRLLGPQATGARVRAEELLGIRNGGQPFSLEASLGCLGNGAAARTIAVFRETARNPAAAKVGAVKRADPAWLEALLEFAPAIILTVNPDGAIEFINRVLPQYSKEQVIGSHWLQYFPPDMHGQMESALEAVLATGAGQVLEAVTTGPDGNNVWYMSQVGPIRDGDRIVGGVVVAQDITERKRAEIELLGARRMAVLGTLAAGVAHEINTPIQFVGDNLNFLREGGLALLGLITRFQALRTRFLAGGAVEDVVAEAAEAEQEADLAYIRDQMPPAFERCIDGLNRVTTIVRSLKEFAHPADEAMSPADLNHAIETTLTIATNEYRYVADLETDLGELPAVVCHVGEINQVILNIVINAAHAIADTVKGTDRKGLIRVRTWRDGNSAIIAIGDNGGGIAESIRARIFDPFFTTKDIGKGTGQGLALALATVKEKHGGDLTFETKIGEGTTFLVRLPIAGKDNDRAPSIPAPA